MITKEELYVRLQPWRLVATKVLSACLKGPVPICTNQCEWKVGFEEDNRTLAQHLSAFANSPGGGFLVFGISNNGTAFGLQSAPYKELKKRIDSISRKSLRPEINLEHDHISFDGKELLVYFVQEATDKPVYLRGGGPFESFIRNLGLTRCMTRTELSRVIANSGNTSADEIAVNPLEWGRSTRLEDLDMQSFFRLQGKTFPTNVSEVTENFVNSGLVKVIDDNTQAATPLGVIMYARDLRLFEHFNKKVVCIRSYESLARRDKYDEVEFSEGYAVAFSRMTEVISRKVLRTGFGNPDQQKRIAIEQAIKELLANAMFHQDFRIPGGPLVEVFEDRVEFSNPGESKVPSDRMLDAAPDSRNERLLVHAREFQLVTNDGNGIDEVMRAAESLNVPPLLLNSSNGTFRATFYFPRENNRLSKEERLRLTYQHCCLCVLGGSSMTNNSLRERLAAPRNHHAGVSRMISDALNAKLVKPLDPSNKSNRLSKYVPYWA